MDLLVDLKDLTKQIDANSILAVSRNIVGVISLWNPIVRMMIGTILNSAEHSYNEESLKKLEEKIQSIILTVENIVEEQKTNKTNFEAMVICPDLFKKILITEDRDKTEYLLHLVQMIFETGKVDFDEIDEAIRIISDLSLNEYKVLKLIPKDPTTWEDIFKIEEMRNLKESSEEYLQILLMSLLNKGLILVNTPLILDGNSGSIRFKHGSETICISVYGDKFIKTINSIEVQE